MRKKNNFVIFACLLVGLLLLAACGNQSTMTSGASKEESSSDYPKKPIKMIVPFTPGGNTDIAAREIAEAANKYMPNKQTIVVENKPGGGGTIGVADVVKAKPDGYTIGTTTGGALVIQPHLGKTQYSIEDVQPIMQIVSMSNVLAVRADAPWKTFEEWLNYVEQNPGQLSYSTAGTGLSGHITMEAINQEKSLKTKHIPFEGAAPAITALLGGHVQTAVIGAIEAKPHVDSGKLRVLAKTGSVKSELFKDIPFLKDKGIDVAFDVWTGIFAPKDLPKETTAILHDVFKKAINDPEVISAYKKLGIDTVYASPEDFKNIIQKDYTRNGEVLKAAGLIK